jgi:excisionase family DNA binding protein
VLRLAVQNGEVKMREGNLGREFSHIMTIKEVARYLSLHELTVRRLAREGKIPAFKIGRQWRVKKDILDHWMERETMRNIEKGDSAWGEKPDS